VSDIKYVHVFMFKHLLNINMFMIKPLINMNIRKHKSFSLYPKAGCVSVTPVVTIWISHTNRGMTSVDVVVRSQCRKRYAVQSLERPSGCNRKYSYRERAVMSSALQKPYPPPIPSRILAAIEIPEALLLPVPCTRCR
jgi:hypothetical protein